MNLNFQKGRNFQHYHLNHQVTYDVRRKDLKLLGSDFVVPELAWGSNLWEQTNPGLTARSTKTLKCFASSVGHRGQNVASELLVSGTSSPLNEDELRELSDGSDEIRWSATATVMPIG